MGVGTDSMWADPLVTPIPDIIIHCDIGGVMYNERCHTVDFCPDCEICKDSRPCEHCDCEHLHFVIEERE